MSIQVAERYRIADIAVTWYQYDAVLEKYQLVSAETFQEHVREATVVLRDRNEGSSAGAPEIVEQFDLISAFYSAVPGLWYVGDYAGDYEREAERIDVDYWVMSTTFESRFRRQEDTP